MHYYYLVWRGHFTCVLWSQSEVKTSDTFNEIREKPQGAIYQEQDQKSLDAVDGKTYKTHTTYKDSTYKDFTDLTLNDFDWLD